MFRRFWNNFWGALAEGSDMVHNGFAAGNAYSRWARSEAEAFEASSKEEQEAKLNELRSKLRSATAA